MSVARPRCSTLPGTSRRLRRVGVIDPYQPARRSERLRELRRLLAHEYGPLCRTVHEAAHIVADEFVPFEDAYPGCIA